MLQGTLENCSQNICADIREPDERRNMPLDHAACERRGEEDVTRMLIWDRKRLLARSYSATRERENSASNKARVCQCVLEGKRVVDADITKALRGLRSWE